MSNSGVRLPLRQISRQWIELDSPNTLHFYIRPFWMVGWQAFFQHSASCTPYLLRQQKRIHSDRRKLNEMETTYIQKTVRHTWTVLTWSYFWMVWNFFLRETIRTTYSTNAFISQMNNNDEIRLQILPIGKNIPRDTHTRSLFRHHFIRSFFSRAYYDLNVDFEMKFFLLHDFTSSH